MQTATFSQHPPERPPPAGFGEFSRLPEGADVEVVHLEAATLDPRGAVDRLLSGRGLLLAAGGPPSEAGWRLLAALHLNLSERPLAGALDAEPANGFFPGPARFESPFPVTGVGYVAFRAQGQPVALLGRRGEGALLLVGSASPLENAEFVRGAVEGMLKRRGLLRF